MNIESFYNGNGFALKAHNVVFVNDKRGVRHQKDGGRQKGFDVFERQCRFNHHISGGDERFFEF